MLWNMLNLSGCSPCNPNKPVSRQLRTVILFGVTVLIKELKGERLVLHIFVEKSSFVTKTLNIYGNLVYHTLI